MSAYPETLLPNARSLLADAADYAVVDLGLAIDDFFTFFSASAYARRIERGDRSTILGISGMELARNVLSEKAGQQDWTGWILAFYQWTSNRTFRDILQALPASTIEQMYGVYHEAPEERFAATADEIIREKFPETRLKRIRSAYGCSQSRLAEMSGVGIRSIQLYEQRKKDINKAEVGSVLRLARALGCEIEDIMEP